MSKKEIKPKQKAVVKELEKEEPLSYVDWLKTLKTDSEVKIHHTKTKIDSIVPMFDSIAFAVRHNKGVDYFSSENGRELGTRKGVYKSGMLLPVTDEDRAEEARKQQEELDNKVTEELQTRVMSLVFGKNPGIYCLRQYLPNEKLLELEQILTEAKWSTQ